MEAGLRAGRGKPVVGVPVVGVTTGGLGAQVRLLGPVDVVLAGEPAPVQGLRRKAVLAALALSPGEIIGTDRLIDVVWSDTAPARLNTVQSHVSYLRRVLGSRSAIRARPPGYVLDLGDTATDAQAADRMIEQAMGHDDPTERAAALRPALRLWRGRALADVSGLRWFAEQAEHLDGVRLRAERALIDARLALGEHAGLVPELERLAQRLPFDEEVHGQLMLALYRAGRQADALGVFRTMRTALRDELGIDPGPQLRRLEAAILRQEPSLAAPVVRLRIATPPPRTLLELGEHALVEDGDLQAGRRYFEAADQAAQAAGDNDAAARAALGLAGLWVHEHRTTSAAAGLRSRLREALDGVDPRSALATRLRVRLAAEADYRAGEHASVLAALDEARRADDPRVLIEALSLAHHCLLGPDHVGSRRELAAELVAESARAGRPGDQLMGLVWQTVDLFLEGHPHAQRRLAELREALAEHDHLAVGFVVSAIEVMLTIRAGRFEEAEALALACFERGEEAGDADAQGWYGAQMVAIRWFQGRLPELLPALEAMVHAPTLSVVDNAYLAALATAAALAGDRRRAASALAALCGDDPADLPRSSSWLVAMHGIAETSYLLGDAATAARVRELLGPYAHLPSAVSLAVACFGSVHQPLGVACLTTGDADAAVGHLRAAVRRDLALAHWPSVVLSRRRLAEALTLRGHPGDARAASAQLVTAAREEAAVPHHREPRRLPAQRAESLRSASRFWRPGPVA
jgi:DNA-binding SARP family transcriptional activator